MFSPLGQEVFSDSAKHDVPMVYEARSWALLTVHPAGLMNSLLGSVSKLPHMPQS